MRPAVETSIRRVRATLTTSHSRKGVLWLDSVAPVAWDSDGDDAVAMVLLEVVAAEGAVCEQFSITGEAWLVFQRDADLDEFLDDIRSSASLESSLRAQLDDMENHYEHEECGTTWVDHHSCGCDDECPGCGTSVSPNDSIQIAGLDGSTPAGYMDMLAAAAVLAEPAAGEIAARPQSR